MIVLKSLTRLRSPELNEIDIANEYWEELFNQAGHQRLLKCFPIQYQHPRSKSTLNIPDDLFEATVWFCKMHNVNLHDVFYGNWAILSVRHMTDGERTALFTVAGRDHSSSGKDEGIEISNNNFLLLLTIPDSIEVLSLIRYVGAVSAKASSHAHIGYKKILAKASAQSPQVKVAISCPGNSQEIVSGDENFRFFSISL